MPCTGDSTIICGGYSSFNIYELETRPTPAPIVSSFEYVGCFKDKRDDRVLSVLSVSSALTPQVRQGPGIWSD